MDEAVAGATRPRSTAGSAKGSRSRADDRLNAPAEENHSGWVPPRLGSAHSLQDNLGFTETDAIV